MLLAQKTVTFSYKKYGKEKKEEKRPCFHFVLVPMGNMKALISILCCFFVHAVASTNFPSQHLQHQSPFINELNRNSYESKFEGDSCRDSDSSRDGEIIELTRKSSISNNLMPLGIKRWNRKQAHELRSSASSIHDLNSNSNNRYSNINSNYNILDKNSVLRLRGGDVVSGRKTKSALKSAKELVDQVKPATRLYLALCVFCTLVHIVGLPAPAMFNIDVTKLHEIWRPITAMAYLGGPSMSMANNLYFLVRYGQSLESENGTGEHSWFLIVQTVILTLLGILLGFPFQAQAMISAAVYVSSHIRPMERLPFQFGMMITSWQLPFCMMGIDCLSQQNLSAAWPHVLGIFSGHCYHFFTKIWPSLGGRAWLQAPKWIIKWGPKPASNVAGIDFRSKAAAAAEAKGKGKGKDKKKKIPMGKGRKLGSLSKK